MSARGPRPDFARRGNPANVVVVACPDEDDVVAFVEGSLDGVESRKVEHHLDGCPSCAQVVAGLVRIFAEDSVPPDVGDFSTIEATETERSGGDADVDDAPVLKAGARVGRYGVLDCIGFGGMGVVYSAYDPELDRRIALKVLRGAGGGADELRRNARLLREAQAMAKLSHPNVITVHDVGNFEGKVFLAMEFVDGTTLGRWMRAKHRAWKEIRTVFLAAGHGLAAAHQAGLVHRDFKPDNVLIGDDGRVRVTDFGLARFRDESIEQSYTDARAREELISGQTLAVGTLTKTGVLVGTPAYMAPEQYEGRTVGSATDQFSFCVALFEALWGERPFEGRTLAELAANVCAGRIRQLRDPGVPSRIRDAVLRGLSFDRKDRFPSMQALLTVLNHRPSRSVRRWAIVGIPTALLALNFWWDAPPASAAGAFCRPEFETRTFWTPEDRGQIETSFVASEMPNAAGTASKALEGLDRFVEDWADARETICARRDGDTLPGNEVLKSHCLLRHRAHFSGLVDAFEGADKRVVSRALGAIEELPVPANCVDDAAVTAALVPMPPAELREEVTMKREELQRAVVGRSAVGSKEAAAAAERLLEDAEALGYAPLVVEARLQVGLTQLSNGEWATARDTLEAVAWQAVEAHHRRVSAAAWIELVFLESTRLGNVDAARRAERAAKAELAALGPAPRLELRLMSHSGALAIVEGRYDEAMTILEAALERAPEDSVIKRLDLLFNIAAIKTQLGQNEEAARNYREFIAVNESEYGRENTSVANGYYNLGATLFRSGQYEEAREQFEHALRIEDVIVDADHPTRADTYGAYASTLALLGEVDAATDNFKRAIAIASQPGRGVPATAAFHRLGLAEHLVTSGDLDQAEAVLRACQADFDRVPELGPEDQARWHGSMCELLMIREDLPSAQRHCEKYLDYRRETKPPDPEEIAEAKLLLAKVVDLADDHAYAAELAESVLATPELGQHIVGKASFVMARQLWHREEYEGARAQARLARGKLTRPRDKEELERVETWLSERDDP